MNKCTRNGETWCVLGEIYPILMVQKVCGLLALITPPPPCREFYCLNWLGGGTEREVRGRTARGEGVGWEGEGKGAIVSGSCGHTSVIGERMKKAPAVQSGRALPMGSCASPPWH